MKTNVVQILHIYNTDVIQILHIIYYNPLVAAFLQLNFTVTIDPLD